MYDILILLMYSMLMYVMFNSLTLLDLNSSAFKLTVFYLIITLYAALA